MMSDWIGFSRSIKLDWLNKAAEIYMEEKDHRKVKFALDKYLTEKIVSKYNRRKTVNILIRIWVNVEPQHTQLRDTALNLFKIANENEKLAIHWSLVMVAYPIFRDITAIIGKLLDLQDDFTLSMVRRRIYELWGERSTLQYALNKIVRSVTEWGTVEDGSKPGDYQGKEQLCIDKKEVKLLLIRAYLVTSEKTCLRFIEVNNLDELFPFKLDLKLDDFNGSKGFSLNKMGSDVVITLQ